MNWERLAALTRETCEGFKYVSEFQTFIEVIPFTHRFFGRDPAIDERSLLAAKIDELYPELTTLRDQYFTAYDAGEPTVELEKRVCELSPVPRVRVWVLLTQHGIDKLTMAKHLHKTLAHSILDCFPPNYTQLKGIK